MKLSLLILLATTAHAETPAQRTMTRTAHRIQRALRAYAKDCGAFPTTEQGLDALREAPNQQPCAHWGPKPYLASIPRDPWNHLLNYSSDGKKAELQSMGKDGKDGGEGEDADVVFRL